MLAFDHDTAPQHSGFAHQKYGGLIWGGGFIPVSWSIAPRERGRFAGGFLETVRQVGYLQVGEFGYHRAVVQRDGDELQA